MTMRDVEGALEHCIACLSCVFFFSLIHNNILLCMISLFNL